ncbi:MAG: hypothetical protein ACYCYK_08870 [Candidatus Dormibacteria bacterium]
MARVVVGLGPGARPGEPSRSSSFPQRQISRDLLLARPWRFPTARFEVPRWALASCVAVSTSCSRERSKENLVASTAAS